MSAFIIYEVRDSKSNRLVAGRSIDEVIEQLVALCENYKEIVKDLQERLDAKSK